MGFRFRRFHDSNSWLYFLTQFLTLFPDSIFWLNFLTLIPDSISWLYFLTQFSDSISWLNFLTQYPDLISWLKFLTQYPDSKSVNFWYFLNCFIEAELANGNKQLKETKTCMISYSNLVRQHLYWYPCKSYSILVRQHLYWYPCKSYSNLMRLHLYWYPCKSFSLIFVFLYVSYSWPNGWTE